MRFLKRPEVVEAIQVRCEDRASIIRFLAGGDEVYIAAKQRADGTSWVSVRTKSGIYSINDGDWIVKLPSEEIVVCKADVFNMLYMPV